MFKFIPERPEGAEFRTLIVLLDGTGDSVDEDVTNIVLLKNMLYGTYKEDDSDKQMVLYLRGIGSPMDGFDPEFDDEQAHPLKSSLMQTWEQAFAPSFSNYVVEPYKWLAKHYRDGDKICIFGFSRGAYTARVLAGMINGVGLLPKEGASEAGVRAAYGVYEKFADLSPSSADKAVRDREWLALLEEFQAFKTEKKSREVFVEFLGCWDTVNSVGYVRAIKLGFTRTNDVVRTFRHAIALDEHRVKFKQNNWSGPPKEIPQENPNYQLNGKKWQPRVKTDVEEVWFAGCHCDIGGGSVLNGTRPNLAYISLRWMIRECFRKNSGMIFNEQAIKIIGIDPSSIYPVVKPRPDTPSFSSGSLKIAVVMPESWGAYLASWIPFVSSQKKGSELQVPNESEEELDVLDALAPMYDQLTMKPSKWLAMEQLPMTKERFKDGKWEEVREQHSSHGRTIPPPTVLHGGKIKVHRTVQIRMKGKFESGKEKEKTYVPLARVGYEEKYKDKTLFTTALEKGWIEWVA